MPLLFHQSHYYKLHPSLLCLFIASPFALTTCHSLPNDVFRGSGTGLYPQNTFESGHTLRYPPSDISVPVHRSFQFPQSLATFVAKFMKLPAADILVSTRWAVCVTAVPGDFYFFSNIVMRNRFRNHIDCIAYCCLCSFFFHSSIFLPHIGQYENSMIPYRSPLSSSILPVPCLVRCR